MAFDTNEQDRYEQISLEKVFLYVNQSLMADYPALRDNAKFSAIRSAEMQNMVMQMKTWCAAGRIPDSSVTETIEWPDGVWQTFKVKFMPAWFVSRFPVRTIKKVITTTLNHYFVCPHIKTPDDRTHIQFMVTGTRNAERMNRF